VVSGGGNCLLSDTSSINLDTVADRNIIKLQTKLNQLHVISHKSVNSTVWNDLKQGLLSIFVQWRKIHNANSLELICNEYVHKSINATYEHKRGVEGKMSKSVKKIVF
jgi:hypothetical protein